MSEPTKPNVWYPVSVEPPTVGAGKGGFLTNDKILVWIEFDAKRTQWDIGRCVKFRDVVSFFSSEHNDRYPITHWMEVGNPNEQELPISDPVIEPTQQESPEVIEAQKEIAVAFVKLIKDLIALSK